MVIDNLALIGVPLSPAKADTPLVIDPDAVQSFTVTAKRLQAVSRGGDKVAEFNRGIQLPELPLGDSLNRPKTPHAFPAMKALRVLAAEALDHTISI